MRMIRSYSAISPDQFPFTVESQGLPSRFPVDLRVKDRSKLPCSAESLTPPIKRRGHALKKHRVIAP